MRKGIPGFYNGQKLRSMNEFLYAVYLDKVMNVEFVTEPFSLRSTVSKRRKIPDFLYTDPKTSMLTLVEVKGSEQEIIDTVVEYCAEGFKDIEKYDVKFLSLTKPVKKRYENLIINVIGKEEWKLMVRKYKDDYGLSKKHFGFPGELNPRYGAIASVETKAKIKAALPDRHGENNSMFGKTHTDEAKKQIGAKWQDPTTKTRMVRKAMVTHLCGLSSEQLDRFKIYARARLTGIKVKRPLDFNVMASVSIERIEKLFNSKEIFLDLMDDDFRKFDEMLMEIDTNE